MRLVLGCILALGLALSPLAPSIRAAGNDDPAAKKNSDPASNKASETEKPAAAPEAAKSDLDLELQQLRDELQQQNELLKQQQEKVQALQDQLKTASTARETVSAASPAPAMPAGAAAAPAASATVAAAQPKSPQADNAEEAPLQLKIGSATIIPIAFMDFTGVWRNHAAGSGIGTNFAGLPYGNVFQNNLNETRFSMQNSRIGFRVDANVKGAHVIGYMEADFLGNNPANVAVSSNSNTLRSRLYWVDIRKGKWEVLGGQTWSLITPGRVGISPLPGDLFYSQDMDVNYQAGLVWGRIPELRLVYHASPMASFAVALDSSEQYVGGSAGGPQITLPAGLANTAGYSLSAGSAEFNNGQTTVGAPNIAPDVIVKAAFDPKRVHFEVGGVERQFKLYNPTTPATFSATGAGGFVNLSVLLFNGFRVLTNNYFSYGGGRYIFGQVPDFTIRPDGSPSPIHASSTVTGIEYTKRNTLIFGYYGAIYVPADVITDTNGKPVGYGYLGSPSSQNRSVQEGTIGFNQTMWKDAKYGALNLIGQYSYVTRSPWSVPAGQPRAALLNMVFLDLRYTLPGSAPAVEH